MVMCKVHDEASYSDTRSDCAILPWNINGVSGALLSHTTEAADETGGHHVDNDNAGVAEVTTKEMGNGMAPMWAQGVRAST